MPLPAPSARLLSVAGVCATLVLVSGCSSPEPAAESLDFSFSYPSTENSPYEALAKRYMEAHPGVEVTLNPVPSESYDTVLNTQLQSGNASDLIMAVPGSGSPIALLSLADAGLLAPVIGSSQDLVPDATAPLFVTGDMTWGVPTDISITGTIFNSSAGVDYPQDTSELLDTCASLSADDVALFALAGSIPINTGLAAISMAASRVYADNPEWDAQRAAGDVSFAGTPGWRDTFQLILDMQAAGCFQPGAEGSGFDAIVSGLGQGTALGAFIPGGAATELAAGMGDQKIVVQSFPAPDDGTPFIFASSDYALAISKTSTHQAGARAFLDWFAEPENAEAYAQSAGSIPITGIEGVDLADSTYAPVEDLIDGRHFVPFPVTVWTNQNVFLTLGSGVQALLTGQQTVDGLLKELDTVWDEQ